LDICKSFERERFLFKEIAARENQFQKVRLLHFHGGFLAKSLLIILNYISKW